MLDNQGLHLYFVEDFSPLVRKIKGKIIALTPKVCYHLNKENIPYQTYEDFYDMFERKKYAKECDQRKFPWFDAFDNYLRTKLSDSLDKKINFARLYGDSIVNMIDAFIIYSRNILSVLDKKRPSKVYLVVSPYSSQCEFGWMLFAKKEDLTPYLLPIICEKEGIPYSVITVNPKNFGGGFIRFKLKRFPIRAFKALGRVINKLYIQIICLLFFLKRKRLTKQGKLKKILILRDDWLGNLYKDAIKAGHQVLYHTMHGPKRNLFFHKKKEDEIEDFYIDIKTLTLWKEIGESCIKEFRPCEWVSNEAGIDLSPVLNPRFLYFLQKVCPIISITAKRYERILKEEKINCVVCQYKTYPSDYGVMAIAKLLPEIFSVHIEHGSSETEYHRRHFSELPADIYIPSSKEEVLFYSKYFDYDNKDKIKVIAARVWIDKYKSETNKTARRFLKSADGRSLKKRKEKVYYVPAIQRFQKLRCTYPLSWYFHFQCNLCKHFAELPQYNFIVKIPGLLWWLFEPLFNFLKDLKAPNIFYKEGDLVANFRQADRVITDLPSTATYEARLMGLPLLSLYHESINVCDGVHKAYGKTVVSFRTTQEALEHIDKFLSSKSKDYIISAEDNFSAPTLLEILENSQNIK